MRKTTSFQTSRRIQQVWMWVAVVFTIFITDGQCHSSGIDPKPPTTLSHVRVSRGPEDVNNNFPDYIENQDHPSFDGHLHSSIKSPSYQHKINHISQFHNTPSSHYSSDVTYSLRPISNAVYPVASLYAKGDSRRMGPMIQHSTVRLDDLGSDNYILDDSNRDDSNTPTFTPYIGSRILANVPKFFEHLQENIKAIHDSTELPDDSSSVSVENGMFFDLSSLENNQHQSPQLDMPTRRGEHFLSDGRFSESEGGYLYAPLDKHGDDDPQMRRYPADASQDMLAYMGRDPKYKKANNYNPSWLFTNLGLGKRSVHRSRVGKI